MRKGLGHLWAAFVVGLTPIVLATSQTTTATWTTTMPIAQTCSNVTLCLAHHQCAQCLAAINISVGLPHTLSENYKPASKPTFYAVAALHEMLATASCSTNKTTPSLLHDALMALTEYTKPCGAHYGMTIHECIIHECDPSPQRPCSIMLMSDVIKCRNQSLIHVEQ